MIKVLHLGHSRKWRGGENQVRLLINGLNSRYSEIQNHIGYPVGAIMIENLSGKADGVLEFPSTRPFDPRCIVSLIRYCNQHAIDVLNAHSGNSHALAYYARQFLPRTKINVHRHVNFPIKDKYFTRKKYLSEKIDHYVAISTAIKARLANYGVAENKISVIKSTVDLTSYQNPKKSSTKMYWCKKYNLQPQLPLLGFAGVLEEKKDPILFVKTISQLKRNGYKVNALIAGAGYLESELQHQIEVLQLVNNIKLTGFINNMPDFFAALDIFILPSKDEGLGTVLLEAIHSQCIVVASGVGGISEIIRDQQTGMLAEAGNGSSFVSATQTLLESATFSAQIKDNAIKHVNRHFDFSNMIDANYQSYQKLVYKK